MNVPIIKPQEKKLMCSTILGNSRDLQRTTVPRDIDHSVTPKVRTDLASSAAQVGFCFQGQIPSVDLVLKLKIKKLLSKTLAP